RQHSRRRQRRLGDQCRLHFWCRGRQRRLQRRQFRRELGQRGGGGRDQQPWFHERLGGGQWGRETSPHGAGGGARARGGGGAGGEGGGGGGRAGRRGGWGGGGGGGGAGLGGAIFNNQGATLTITNSTLTGNTAEGGAGGTEGDNNPGRSGQGLGGAVF